MRLVLLVLAMTVGTAAFSAASSASDCIDYGEYCRYEDTFPLPHSVWFLSASGNHLLATKACSLLVMDASEHAMPEVVGCLSLPGSLRDVVITGKYAIPVGSDGILRIIDWSDPSSPRVSGSIRLPNEYEELATSGPLLCAIVRESGLAVVDISVPARPELVSVLPIVGYPRRVAVGDRVACVINRVGLQVVDLADPRTPRIVATVDSLARPGDVQMSGTVAWVIDVDRGLQMVDLSDPEHPRLGARVPVPFEPESVTLVGSLACLSGSGILVADSSDPEHPTLLGGIGSAPARTAIRLGTTLFACDGQSLRRIGSLERGNPLALGSIPVPGGAWDVAASGGIACAAGSGMNVIDLNEGRVLARVGPWSARSVDVNGGYAFLAGSDPELQVIDLADPRNPQVVGSFDAPDYAEGVRVFGTRAYLIDQSGIKVIDVSNPRRPSFLTSILGWTNDIVVSGSLLVTADHHLRVYDDSDPFSPVLIGDLALPEPVVRIALSGAYAFLAAGRCGLVVVDLSDPRNPAIVGKTEYPVDATLVTLEGSIAYVGGPVSGLTVVDVGEPWNPRVIGQSGPRPIVSLAMAGSRVLLGGRDGITLFPAQCSSGKAPPAGDLSVFPNPVPGPLSATFDLPRSGRVTLLLFDSAGRRLRAASFPDLRAGRHTLTWQIPEALPSGRYWLGVEGPAFRRSRPCLVLR